MSQKITFFVDFDNTISNNDKLKVDIQKLLIEKFDKNFSNGFVEIAKKIRTETGHDNISRTFKELAAERNMPELANNFHQLFHDFTFKKYLFDHALEIIKHLNTFGKVTIFTEGQKYYQTLKIKNSGAWDTVRV